MAIIATTSAEMAAANNTWVIAETISATTERANNTVVSTTDLVLLPIRLAVTIMRHAATENPTRKPTLGPARSAVTTTAARAGAFRHAAARASVAEAVVSTAVGVVGTGGGGAGHFRGRSD